jgi:hypothetical protein
VTRLRRLARAAGDLLFPIVCLALLIFFGARVISDDVERRALRLENEGLRAQVDGLRSRAEALQAEIRRMTAIQEAMRVKGRR